MKSAAGLTDVGRIEDRDYSEVSAELERRGLRFLRPRSHGAACATWDIESRLVVGTFSRQHSGVEVLRSCDRHERAVGGARVVLSGNRILAFNGLEKHTEIYDGRAEKHQSIVISEDRADSILDGLGGNCRHLEFHELVASDDSLALQRAFENLFDCRSGVQNDPFSSECFAAALLVELLCQRENTFSEKIRKQVSRGCFPDALSRARRLLAERYDDPALTLSDLARLCGMSKFHFLRSFKRDCGLTPVEYLTRLRVNRASVLLERGGLSTSEVSERVGFRDFSTFYRQFRKRFGTTPGRFRQTTQE